MPRFSIALLAAVLALAAPAALRAQDEDTTAVPRVSGRLIEPFAGARVGFPMKLSGFVGLGLVDHRTKDEWSGWSIMVEPGLGGGQVGFGRTVIMPYASTARIQAAVLRTWGDPWLVGPDRTYVGIDESLTFMHVGFSFGGYIRIPEEGDNPGVMFSAGLMLTL
jgi:hypothetical protein